MKFSEILSANKKLEATLPEERYSISVLSNITMNQSKDILEFALRSEGIPAEVGFGDYDNIVQDSLKFKESKLVILFWELANLTDGQQYKTELMSSDDLEVLITKTKSEIDFVLSNLNKTSLVLFNTFSSLVFNYANLRENQFDYLKNELNAHLKSHSKKNVIFVDIDKIIAKVGISESVSFRYYYSSKALYSIEFFKEYANFIKPAIMSANGKAKKALIFDCDNTLWKGIVGEDGFEGIKMSANDPKGVVFEEVQNLGLTVNQTGILLGLCSKNNAEDVDEVLEKHSDMSIRDEKLTIKKVNWTNKATNLRNIALDLNIGLDSLVFVDDSDFEVNLIREQLPQVKVIQVPKKSYDYPRTIREQLGAFFNISNTEEDRKKVQMYASQVKREQSKNQFSNIEEYLESLGLVLTIYENDDSIIPRMAQMTQKTNQFNLTTKRYTEADISNFIRRTNCHIYAFGVSDKYGDSGITGLMIADEGKIDTFLMSCRVLGRNIEISFFNEVVKNLKEKGLKNLKATYIPTIKNKQVSDLYDRFGLKKESEKDGSKFYVLDILNHQYEPLKYIEVKYGR